MANTYTTNYSLIKSEIGGDNQNWGANIHTNYDEIDLELGSKVDDVDMKGFKSSVLTFTNTGSSEGTIESASGNLFQNFKVGDKIRVSGCNSATNGSTAAPKTHTIKDPGGKVSSNKITVTTGLVAETNTTDVIIALVLEPKHISGGPIICAPPSGDTTTQALVATGSATIGGASTDDVTVTASVNSDLIPKTDVTHDLGSSTKQWDKLYSKSITTPSDGTYTLNGSGTVAGVTVTSSGSELGSGHKTVNIAVTGTAGSYTNFNLGSNGQGNKIVSTSAPSATTGFTNGDVWYEIP